MLLPTLQLSGVWIRYIGAPQQRVFDLIRCQELFDKVPPGLNPNVTGWLVYDDKKKLPAPTLIDEYYAFDDFALVPHDGQELYEDVNYSFTMTFKMANLGNGAN